MYIFLDIKYSITMALNEISHNGHNRKSGWVKYWYFMTCFQGIMLLKVGV
jgi:hypothetical protein